MYCLSDAEQRSQLSTQIIAIFAHWELSKSQQYTLLGLSPDTPELLEDLHQGEPLVDDIDKLERVQILLEIHKCLRILFPRNRDLAYRWMSTPNRVFRNRSPVELVEQHGMLGLHQIRTYLHKQVGY